jgi:hypothetical protein
MEPNEMTRRDPFEEETQIVRTEPLAMAAINRSEVEAQLDAAHKYPRSVKRFLDRALSLATLTQEIAESCIYSLPRSGKQITGPSVRLAEICASTYGNIHVGARPIDVGDLDCTSQGVAWDLESNYRVTIEAKRRITNKNGSRYNEDMIAMTQNAASSIAFRNAIFRVIPRAYIDRVYADVVKVAVGDAKTLATKRADLMGRLQKLGADEARVLAACQKESVLDIGLPEMEFLIGLGTAIKNGERSVDDAFPAPLAPVSGAGAPEGKRMSLKKPEPVKSEDKPAAEEKKTEDKRPEEKKADAPAGQQTLSAKPKAEREAGSDDDKGDAPTAEEMAKGGK